MKVLIAHNRYRSTAPSGENRAVDADIALLLGAGVDVVPMIEESDSLAGSGLPGMALAAVGPVYSPSGLARFRRLLAEERPEIVHLHNVYPLISPWVIRVAHQRNVPVVHTAHNYRHTCVNGLHYRDGHICDDCLGRRVALPAVRHGCYRGSRPQSVPMAVGQALHRSTWASVDRHLALTPFMKERLVAGGLPAERITVRPSWSADPGPQPPPGRDILFLGRLDESKGVSLLLAAWGQASEKQGRLVIAGAGPLLPAVREAAALDPSVVCMGAVDAPRVSELISGCGVVVVPSLVYEGFPLTVVEAFAHGRPVAVTDGGSASSVVPAGCGWSIPAQVDAWRAWFTTLKADNRPAMGAAARRHWEAELSPDRALAALVTAYEDVLAARRSGNSIG